MITFIEALRQTFKLIHNRESHQDYDHVNKYAKKCWRLCTGEEVGELLEQFVRRETEEAFNQRCMLTSLITPAIINSVNNEFYKAGRSDNVVEVIRYQGEEDSNEVKEGIKIIEECKANFYGRQSVNDYLSDEMVDVISYDPNSFILIEFDQFDSFKEKPKPRPRLIRSEYVFNFKFENNNLEYLIEQYNFTSGDKEIERFILHGRQWSASFTEVEEIDLSLSDDLIADMNNDEVDPVINSQNQDETITLIDGPLFLVANEKKYQIQYYNHTAEFVPAFRTGYRKDKITNGRTCVTNWHAGMSWFNKMMKSGSELDLSIALHAFPQKISYERGCPGISGNPCRDGLDTNGQTCKRCSGTGFVDDHTSAQDVVKFRFPNLKQGETLFDLSKLIAYITPDIDLIKWLDEYIDKLELKFKKSVFNSNSFDRDTAMKTATENILDLDNIYDALFPYTQWYSESWIVIMNCIAVFTDTQKDLVLNHEFGKDLKFETETQLISQIKTLEESNAPYFIKQHTTQKLAALIHKDNPIELNKFKAKNEHTPFIGKSENEIIFLLSSPFTTRETKVLYSNIDTIFDSIDNKFYDMTYEKQKEVLDAEVAKIIQQIDAEVSAASPLTFQEDEGEEAS